MRLIPLTYSAVTEISGFKICTYNSLQHCRKCLFQTWRHATCHIFLRRSVKLGSNCRYLYNADTDHAKQPGPLSWPEL